MKNGNGIDLNAGMACPIPISDYKKVLLAHGGGGRLSQRLINEMFVTQFRNEHLDTLHDGAILSVNNARLAFSTDSFVISPLFFPGGDIGTLAVNGTVNDLAMCGATPLYLSAAFIIEEGFSMDFLFKLVNYMKEAAGRAGVQLVTGDTKVVDKGKGDKIFINTSGIGSIPDGIDINPKNARAGDKIILSGTIADHGMAIMSVRENL
jgi:hydrogenase expression/formation protein HypE